MKKRINKAVLKDFLENVFYSFPVQLFINHCKKNQVLLLVWALLFGFVTQSAATIMGVPYLFLDPEYLHQTDPRGFFIIGVAFGVFISAFHITTYILDSYRFTFLGTVAHPFTNFCLNNSLIPVAFVTTYTIAIIRFQTRSGFQDGWQIFFELMALYAGLAFTIYLLFLYFRFTNKDIFKELTKNLDSKLRKNTVSRVNVMKKIKFNKRNKYRVLNYFTLRLKLVKVSEYNSYDKELLLKIFDQNHLNAVMVELFVILVIIALGLFRDIDWFQIPAAASGVLFFSVIIMFTGAFSYWMRNWSITILIFSLVILNFLFKKDFIDSSYQVFGINYNKKSVEYSLDKLNQLSNKVDSDADYRNTLAILENWKKKFPDTTSKPKMIFICTSGGGQRAAVWTTRALQHIDSASNGKLMNQSVLITGASGGLIGAAYYRELFLRKQSQDSIQLNNKRYFDNMAKDVLNPIIFSMVVNDIFFRFQKFSDGKYEYLKDRGYAFEEQINQNVEYVLNKRIADYKEPEQKAQIPMLLISPTVINDRKLFISPQDISYMTLAGDYENAGLQQKIKGIEFRRFFEDHDPDNLRYISALRMSATFPYITPNVDLPSNPRMEIMDAGLSDNFGINNAVRFLHVFREWIEKNTGGVVFVIIRDSEKDIEVRKRAEVSIIQKVLTPIGSLYSNWDYFQDFNNDNLLEFAQTWYRGPFDVVEFQYISQYEDWQKNRQLYSELDNYEKNRAALSWHLTAREKQSLFKTITEPNNVMALKKFKSIVK
jgi:hypothetical protein